jgi:hypothetical protein
MNTKAETGGNVSEDSGRFQKPHVSETKKHTIGKTTFNVGVAYDESGDTISDVFLQIMKDKVLNNSHRQTATTIQN